MSNKVIEAYADCCMEDERRAAMLRNLNFRDDRWLSLDEWEECMLLACPDGYNGFNAYEIAEVIRMTLEGDVDDVRLQVAREGSVACYISGDVNLLKKIRNLVHYFDEADIKNNELRLWWD